MPMTTGEEVCPTLKMIILTRWRKTRMIGMRTITEGHLGIAVAMDDESRLTSRQADLGLRVG
jgi:hypothetical protein